MWEGLLSRRTWAPTPYPPTSLSSFSVRWGLCSQERGEGEISGPKTALCEAGTPTGVGWSHTPERPRFAPPPRRTCACVCRMRTGKSGRERTAYLVTGPPYPLGGAKRPLCPLSPTLQGQLCCLKGVLKDWAQGRGLVGGHAPACAYVCVCATVTCESVRVPAVCGRASVLCVIGMCAHTSACAVQPLRVGAEGRLVGGGLCS